MLKRSWILARETSMNSHDCSIGHAIEVRCVPLGLKGIERMQKTVVNSESARVPSKN